MLLFTHIQPDFIFIHRLPINILPSFPFRPGPENQDARSSPERRPKSSSPSAFALRPGNSAASVSLHQSAQTYIERYCKFPFHTFVIKLKTILNVPPTFFPKGPKTGIFPGAMAIVPIVDCATSIP